MLKADMAISDHHSLRIDFFLDLGEWCCWIGNSTSAGCICNKGGLSPSSSLRPSCGRRWSCWLLSRVRWLLEYSDCSGSWIKVGVVEADIGGSSRLAVSTRSHDQEIMYDKIYNYKYFLTFVMADRWRFIRRQRLNQLGIIRRHLSTWIGLSYVRCTSSQRVYCFSAAACITMLPGQAGHTYTSEILCKMQVITDGQPVPLLIW